MRIFLSKDMIRRPIFSLKLLSFSFAFLIVGEFLDGFTTKIGLDLGLAEVGRFAMPVLSNHGFWGLMVWKFGIIAFFGAFVLAIYFGAKKFAPDRLSLVCMILTVGCLIAGIGSVQVDVSNILQIELALQHS